MSSLLNKSTLKSTNADKDFCKKHVLHNVLLITFFTFLLSSTIWVLWPEKGNQCLLNRNAHWNTDQALTHEMLEFPFCDLSLPSIS